MLLGGEELNEAFNPLQLRRSGAEIGAGFFQRCRNELVVALKAMRHVVRKRPLFETHFIRCHGVHVISCICERERGAVYRFDFAQQFRAGNDSRVLILGHARGDVMAHGRESVPDQLRNSAVQNPGGSHVENRRNEGLVFEKINRADGHVVEQPHAQPVRTYGARRNAGRQNIFVRDKANRVVVKNRTGKAGQVVDKGIPDQRRRESQILLEAYFLRSAAQLWRIACDGDRYNLIGSIAAENMRCPMLLPQFLQHLVAIGTVGEHTRIDLRVVKLKRGKVQQQTSCGTRSIVRLAGVCRPLRGFQHAAHHEAAFAPRNAFIRFLSVRSLRISPSQITIVFRRNGPFLSLQRPPLFLSA